MIAQYLFHPECEFLSAASPVPSETIFKSKSQPTMKKQNTEFNIFLRIKSPSSMVCLALVSLIM